MSTTKESLPSVKVNYIYNMCYQILAIVSPLITTPYVSRTLGAEGVGIYSYVNSIAYVFLMFVYLGTRAYGQREIAFCREDKHLRSILFWEINKIKLFTFAIATLMYSVLVVVSNQYKIIFILMFGQVIAALIDISWFFQGLEDFKKTVTRNIIVKILGIILIFLLVKKSEDLWLYTVILCGAEFVGNLTMWMYIPKYIELDSTIRLDIKKHLVPIITLFLPSLASYVYTSLDKVMLGIITTTVQVGYYSQSERVIKLLITNITSLGAVLVPRFSNLMRKNEWGKVQGYFDKAIRFVLMLCFPMMAGLVIVADQFIPWFLGEEFVNCISLLQLITPLTLILGLSGISGQAVLVSMGKQVYYTKTIVVGSILNLFLNICLIPRWGAKGAVIATLVAEGIITLLQYLGIHKKLKLGEAFFPGIRYVVYTVIMSAATIITKIFIGNMFVEIILGGIVYLLLLLVTRDQMVVQVLQQIKGRISRN